MIEHLQHVRRARDRDGAEADQRVRSGREGARDLAGNREHVPPLLQREVGRDEGAAPLSRLDDDGRFRETGDDPIASRKTPRCGLDTWLVLGDDQTPLADPTGELGVGSRIVAVDSATEYGDGDTCFERSAVNLAVDPSRHSADHDEPCSRQLPPERTRHGSAVRRARARADHGDCTLREKLIASTAANEERRRRIVDRRQEARVLGVAPPEPANLGHTGIR